MRSCTLFLVLLFIHAGCSRDDDFVDVPGGVFSESQIAHVVNYHHVLLDDVGVEFVLIVTATAAANIDTLAAELFERKKIGRAAEQEKGVLLLIDPVGRQVRLQTSYSVEAVFPDSFIGYVERRQMLPYFQSGRIGDGALAAVELLVARLLTSGEGLDEQKESTGNSTFLSGGGGAKTHFDQDLANLETGDSGQQVPAQPTPALALEAYRKVLASGNKRADLDLYTPESRIFFSTWIVTDAQQHNELQTVQRVREKGTMILQENRAVFRSPVAERGLAPYFFKKGNGGWMLDFATMSRVLQFNHKNQWHFKEKTHSYMFAFEGWRLDVNGFPREKELD